MKADRQKLEQALPCSRRSGSCPLFVYWTSSSAGVPAVPSAGVPAVPPALTPHGLFLPRRPRPTPTAAPRLAGGSVAVLTRLSDRCHSIFSSPQPWRLRPSSGVSFRGSQLSIVRAPHRSCSAPPRPCTHSLSECFLGARSVPGLRAGDGAPWTIGLCPGARVVTTFNALACVPKRRSSTLTPHIPPSPAFRVSLCADAAPLLPPRTLAGCLRWPLPGPFTASPLPSLRLQSLLCL